MPGDTMTPLDILATNDRVAEADREITQAVSREAMRVFAETAGTTVPAIQAILARIAVAYAQTVMDDTQVSP